MTEQHPMPVAFTADEIVTLRILLMSDRVVAASHVADVDGYEAAGWPNMMEKAQENRVAQRTRARRTIATIDGIVSKLCAAEKQ